MYTVLFIYTSCRWNKYNRYEYLQYCKILSHFSQTWMSAPCRHTTVTSTDTASTQRAATSAPASTATPEMASTVQVTCGYRLVGRKRRSSMYISQWAWVLSQKRCLIILKDSELDFLAWCWALFNFNVGAGHLPLSCIIAAVEQVSKLRFTCGSGCIRIAKGSSWWLRVGQGGSEWFRVAQCGLGWLRVT